ncbi:SEC-C domain-containing protein [Streptomyces sp. PVA_94-07]|nr:SEC-C domain-containing protein [Streptomyces sp. PVA_94-07]
MRPAGPCPCGTGRTYGECCGRFHAGSAEAATAEQLMRSRYAAFATRDAAYLLRTWHPHPPRRAGPGRRDAVDGAGDHLHLTGQRLPRHGDRDLPRPLERRGRVRGDGGAQPLHPGRGERGLALRGRGRPGLSGPRQRPALSSRPEPGAVGPGCRVPGGRRW